jgi:acetyl esterase/lipase
VADNDVVSAAPGPTVCRRPGRPTGLTTVVVVVMVMIALSALASARPTAGHDPPGSVTASTVRYGSGPDATMTVYSPTAPGRRPAVLVVHGGGWVGPTVRPGVNVYANWQSLAQQRGWVVALPNYPVVSSPIALSRGHSPARSVAAVEGAAVLSALLRLRGRGDVNPRRVALWGDSAGGQLALLTAYQHPGLASAVVSSSGPTDMAVEAKDAIVGQDVVYYEGVDGATAAPRDQQRFAATSPVDLVTPQAPPTYQIASRADPAVQSSQALELSRRLEALGVPHGLDMVAGSVHSPEILGGAPLQAGLDFVQGTIG